MSPEKNLTPTFETIALDGIDRSDDTFRITTESDLEGLSRSISTVGVLSPPTVLPGQGGMQVISGFRRIEACSLLNRHTVVCRILSAGSDFPTCAKIAIADNISCRQLNPVELSRAYRLLSREISSAETLLDTARQVGLPAGQELMEKLWDLCEASKQIRQGVLRERISLPVALELIRMPEAAADAVAGLLMSVPLSLNRQREVLSLLQEIARREDLDLPDLVCEPEVTKILGDPDADSAKKGRSLLAVLVRRRFPSRARFEATFEHRRRKLSLGTDMALLPPPNFEGNRYVLKLSFQSVKQFKEQAAKVQQIAHSTPLQEILSGE